ncbi:MAG: hypothetical protein QOE98_357 [Gaiellaceae bacterium]|nr:hypothetical protein [Gaiellaceae bacterium]
MSFPTLLCVLLVAVVAASGAAYGVLQLVHPANPSLGATSRAALGQTFPTAFGEVSVEHIERTSGLTSEALSGVTHGIQGLVPVGSEQVEVSLLLHNTTGHQTRWATKFFALKSGADGKRTGAPVTVGNPGGYIPSGAMVEALLTFVVLSDGNGQQLVYHDPANGNAVEISLGRAYRADGSSADNAHGH